MRNWKTTTCSAATAFFAFVAFSPEYFPAVIVSLAKFAAAGGLLAFGISAADAKKKKK